MNAENTGPVHEAAPPPEESSNARSGWLWLLFASVALTAMCCFPIVLNPSGHLAEPPYGDKGTNLWNLWWVYYALFERGTSPLDCDIVFSPWGIDLRHHTLSLANGFLAAPVTAFFGPVISFNLLFILWTALTLHFAALWARGYGLGMGASLFVGFAAAMGPYRWAHLHHLNLFSTAWLFVAFYACDRMIREANWRMSALFTLSWVISALTDWYYGIFVGLYLALRLFFGLLETRSWREIGVLLGSAMCAILALFLAVSAYFARPDATNRPDMLPDPTSPSVASYWSLDVWHLALPPWVLAIMDMPVHLDGEFHLHLGVAVMLFGLLGLFFAKGVRGRVFLLALAMLFFLLALGPFLRVGGEPLRIEGWRIPLPGAVYALIPPLVSMRVFTRFAYIGFMAICLLAAGMAGRWTALLSKPLRPIIWIALGAMVLIESDWRPPHMTIYHLPEEILYLPDGGVAEFPHTPTEYSGLHLYHQTMHRRPIYVAEFSRLGNYKRDYLSAFPILTAWNQASRGEIALESLNLAELCSQATKLNIRTFIVHDGENFGEWLDAWEETCFSYPEAKARLILVQGK